MKKKVIELPINTSVVFNEEDHTYLLGDTQLSGITSRLGKSIFFWDKFKGIPKHILTNKAAFGTMVHKTIEMYDTGQDGYMPIPELDAYVALMKEKKITHLASEYLVSDNANYATMVDKIDNKLNFYDHKTSYKLDLEYLSWQLSINKYLFYVQTGMMAGKLFAIHYKNGGCKLYKIEEKSFEECYDMLYTDKYMYSEEGQEETNAIDVLEADDVLMLKDIEIAIVNMEKQIDELAKQKKEFLEKAKENMAKHGVKKWEADSFVITFVPAHTRETLDSKALKENHQDIYDKFLRVSFVDDSVRLKIKKDAV